jgi:two-component system, sensor histidine kinase PdtaS
VLNELMQNAVDHAYPRDGTGPVEGLVEIRLNREDSELLVEVRDDGVGLPSGFTFDASKGLGLSIVQALVTGELQGSIEMRADPSGRGTYVRLRAPLAPATPVEL